VFELISAEIAIKKLKRERDPEMMELLRLWYDLTPPDDERVQRAEEFIQRLGR
jgi:hypothetical protein